MLDELIQNYLKDAARKGEKQPKDIHVYELQKLLGFSFPLDYLEVVKEYEEVDGPVGKEGWLSMFEFHELYDINIVWYKILMDDIPDFFLFGKDAADTGYAFHKHNHSYHAFGLMSNFDTDGITFCGNNFLDFLKAIATGSCYR